jgi:hypothetical protein
MILKKKNLYKEEELGRLPIKKSNAYRVTKSLLGEIFCNNLSIAVFDASHM